MFDRIAPVYDAMNPRHDGRTRPALAADHDRRDVRKGDQVLDACCGTGDLAIGARARGRKRSDSISRADARPGAAQEPAISWVQGDMWRCRR